MIGNVLWSEIGDRPSWRWGRVRTASPLRLEFMGPDGWGELEGVTPDTLVAGLVVGDRVWVQLEGPSSAKQVVIVGRAGG